MIKKNTILLLLVIMILSFSILGVLHYFERDMPIAESGYLKVSREDMNQHNHILPLKGDFMVHDGIVAPEDFDNINVRLMTLNEIRLYDYPKGTLTAKMVVETENVSITGIIIEEIYTSNKVFVNGKLLSSAGYIDKDKKNTIKEKKSVFLPLNNIEDTFEVVIQIGNCETISGQLERNIFIGDFNSLQHFYNLKFFIKLLCMGFFITVSFFLFGLYIKNRKYGYLLSLSLAGILNFYFLLTHFEPIVFFHLTDKAYLVNSWLHTFPAVYAQFFSAITVILFYRLEPIYRYRKKFIITNMTLFLIPILILIVFDKVSYPLYLFTILYPLGLMVYAGIMSGKRFIAGERNAIFIFTGLFVYVLSFGLLIYIIFDHNPYQTLSHYNIFTMLPQVLFYIILCYFIITYFSKQFSISELSEAELSKRIEKKNAQLKHSFDKLKQKDTQRAEMLMNISHDLRSPMTVVKGYLDLLNKGKIDKDMFNKYIEIIYSKVSYVIDLINELLDLAHLDNETNITMTPEYIDMIIDKVIAQYKGMDYTITSDLPKKALILCSGKNMFRLFSNLLDNAIEYSGGNADIRLLGEITDGQVIIKVKDNGKGIETKDLSHIFERFTTRNTQSNEHNNHFGLGLAICKAIVQNHNGTISCESILGEGSTFTMTFPLYKEEVYYETTDH